MTVTEKFSSRRKATTAAALALAPLLGAVFPAPAVAQYYYAPPNLATPPVTGLEPELGLGLPGATPEELRAGLIWHLRVAMNVAALQCDFEPGLLTVSNYNATLAHHKTELADSFLRLGGYFKRVQGNAKSGQRGLDEYNTRTYSSYSTVFAQRDFCNVMAGVGRDAIFATRGALIAVAQRRLGEIRKSLMPAGDQYFTNPAYGFRAVLPSLTKKCWKKDKLRETCAQAWTMEAASRPAN